jgi:ATP-binding cassette subfamily B protein
MLTWPVTSVGWVTSLVQRAAASQKRINEFLETTPEIKNESVAISKDLKGKISFKNVSFTYPDTGIKAIKNMSFEVMPNETLAIIGKTGSGKSTLANLLFRMYDVDAGEIKLDDQNIKTLNLYNFRKQIALVPQEVFLFSDSIKNNIAFGKDEKDFEEIVKVAKQAAIYDNIMQFNEGFETKVGERGITLSGGQKQRVSIARAIIMNPKIMVFDDALSAVDTKTEELILSSLNEIMKNRTSIIISHRVSTIRNANKILFLDAGEIVESGNHEELMKLNGAYAELYQKQLLEEEKVQ